MILFEKQRKLIPPELDDAGIFFFFVLINALVNACSDPVDPAGNLALRIKCF